MEPRYHPGELIFMHPGRPITAGCYVMVQLRAKAEGEPPPALVKRLAKKTGIKYVLEQFNPPRTFDIQIAERVSIHRIVASVEKIESRRPAPSSPQPTPLSVVAFYDI